MFKKNALDNYHLKLLFTIFCLLDFYIHFLRGLKIHIWKHECSLIYGIKTPIRGREILAP